MNLKEIRNAITSDKAFSEFVGDSPSGMTIEMIIKAIELDGELVNDRELIDLIAEIIYMYQYHKENN